MLRLLFKRSSIAAKLNLVLCLVLVTVFTAFGVLQTRWLGQQMEERALAQMQQANRQVIDMMDAYAVLLERSAALAETAFVAELPRALSVSAERAAAGARSAPTLRDGARVLNGSTAEVDRFGRATGAIATLFVRDGRDWVRVATSVKKEDGQRAIGTVLDANHPAYARLAAGESYTGPAKLFGRQYMTRYSPLRDASGAVIGAVFVGVDFTESLATLRQKVLSVKIGETGYVYAFDARAEPGRMMLHPSAEGRNFLDFKDHGGRPFFRTMLEQKSGTIRYDWINPGETEPREKLTVFAPFERWGWIVGAGSYRDEFLHGLHQLQLQFAAGLAVVLALVLAATVAVTRLWISRPLALAVEATRRVAAGDLGGEVAVDSADEVGQLLDATNVMCRELRGMIGEIERSMAALSNNAGTLVEISGAVSAASGEQNMAASAMAASVEEMSTSIGQVAQHASQARQMAKASGEVSTRGAEVVDQAVGSMHRIAAVVRQSAGAVGQLDSRSEQISQMVTVIRDIAEQTNLLALNAAIEAARAGEAGRGFAVVADEVRKLAERTTQSTVQITQTVEQIQAGAREAVASMNSGVEAVDEGVGYAGEAGRSLASIRAGAGQVGDAVTGISDALGEQDVASRDIALNVEKIAQQADFNHGRAREAAEAAATLAKLAGQLRASIARFRL